MLFILGAPALHPVSGAATSLDAFSVDARESLMIVEFYPCATNSDEYLVLSNRGPESVNLLDWKVSDGEGVIRLLGGMLLPGQTLSVSENASSYASAYGRAPDIQVVGWSSGDMVEVTGRFRLADAGDGLELISPEGMVVDVVVYGDAVPPPSGWSGAPVPPLRPGEVIRRSMDSAVVDTDTASDWTRFREFRYGYTDNGSMSCVVPAGCITSFTSPDCSLDVVLETISGATSSVRVCSYELSSPSVCNGLLEAASKGVEVQVLVDAVPVGGMSIAEVECLSCLSRRGVDVRVLGGNLDSGVVRHVGALHAKYMVVDDAILVAMSENFVEDGVPVDRLFGNRGWGISVSDCVIASCISSVFDDDSRLDRSDVWPWIEDLRFDATAEVPIASITEHCEGMLSPEVSSEEAIVSLYLSPDASSDRPFLQSLISSDDDVTFEQFQAELEWTTRWSSEPILNPVVDAVCRVLRGGGSARGIFDGTWYNVEDNSEVKEHLNTVALASGQAPSFVLLPEESPITTLHNKGLLLGSSSVVSSNNWVYASFARNRELAVVVESDDVSSYFSDAFELDWVPDTNPPVASAGKDIVVDWPCDVILDASGSWDDRAIADVSWDLDADGRMDAEGFKVGFVVDVPGRYEVGVKVTDAWGNTAEDTVVVTVGASDTVDVPAGRAVLRIPWPLPAALSVLVSALAAARKLNLLRSVTRGKG